MKSVIRWINLPYNLRKYQVKSTEVYVLCILERFQIINGK